MKDLDDVESILKERRENRVIVRRRSQERRAAMERRRKKELSRSRGIVWIPAMILVLTLLVKILDHGGTGGEAETQSIEQPTSEAAESSAQESTGESPAETEDPTLVREYHDNVLEKFFEDYFAAKLAADTDKLYKMSGVHNQTEAQMQQLRGQLKAQSGYIERYQDIHLYAVKGLEENSKLVFLTYQVKFRRAETLAPAIMYCYIRVNEQNEFELVENMGPEQVRFVNLYTTEHTEVIELINAVNSRLLAALSSDSRLAVIYDAFQTGRIYTEDQASIDSEVSLIRVETEAAVTEAPSSSQAAETAAESRSRAETQRTAAGAESASGTVRVQGAGPEETESSSAVLEGVVEAPEDPNP